MYTYLITLYFIAQVYLIGEFFSRRTWVKFTLVCWNHTRWVSILWVVAIREDGILWDLKT